MSQYDARIIQVAMGANHALALRANGTVVAWGGDRFGQCNLHAGLDDVVQIAAGGRHSLVVRKNGQVVVSHKKNQKQRGAKSVVFRYLRNRDLRHVVQVAAGHSHSLAVTSQRKVVAWGENDGDQCNVPTGLDDVMQVAAGYKHSLALIKNGQVVVWGRNDYGQCNVPTDLHDVAQIAAGGNNSVALTAQGQVVVWGPYAIYLPKRLVDVVQVAAGYTHSLALTRQGKVVAWGNNSNGQCNVPTGLRDVVQVVAGGNNSVALTAQGQVVVWGEQIRVLDVVGQDVVQVSFNGNNSVALTTQRQVVALGSNKHGQFDVPTGLDDVMQVAAGYRYSLAVTVQGRVVAWGTNNHGQCDVPIWLKDVVQVAAGSVHSLALTTHGQVVAWGANNHGQCDVPVWLKDVVQVVAGNRYSLAVTAQGRVVEWGKQAIHCPKRLVDVDVVQVAAGYGHLIAVTRQGQVVAWGANNHGQCSVPAGLADVVQVAAGDDYSVALTTQGQVVAWGNSSNGQCDIPVWLKDVVQVATLFKMSCALLRSGRIVLWGGNSITDTHRLIQIGTSPHLQYIHPFAAYEGGEAQLFSTPSGLLKKYHTSEKTPALAKLQHLIAHPVTLTHADHPLIIWPQELAYHPFKGELVGYVMPFVAATPLIDVLDRTKRLARWPEMASDSRREWQFVLHVARWSAAVLAHIHAHGYVVGDLSPRNILVYDEGTVAFVDCDSYQVGDGSEYSCSVSTAGYRAPEVRQHTNGRLQYSVHSDAFALAVAIFRLLCGNLHPYQGITLPSAKENPEDYAATKALYPHLQPIPNGVDATTYCEKKGFWPYDQNQQICLPPVKPINMQAYYPQLLAAVRGLFGRAFTGAPAQRPTPVEWVQVLDAWLGQVKVGK